MSARRISIAGDVPALAVRDEARALGLLGWVRLEPDGTLSGTWRGTRLRS